MPKIASSRTTFGGLTETQKTVDLPASGGTAVTIDCNPTGGSRYAQISIYAHARWRYAYRSTADLAIAALASGDTSRVLPSILMQLPIIGNSGYLAVKAYENSAVTDGLSYEFVEADDGSVHGG